MSRSRLYIYSGKRSFFTGTFVRYGENLENSKTTVLLREIRDAYGELVGDHCWFEESADFISIGVEEGDRVGFNAYVRQYSSGYLHHDRSASIHKDWKMEKPSNIRIVERIGEETIYGKPKNRRKERGRRNRRFGDVYSV